MQNITAHVETAVREAIASQARALGIDKNEFGFAVGGFGAIGLVIDSQGNTHVMPRWNLVLTLRHKLLGYPPKGGALPIPGMLPSDAEIGEVVTRLAAGLNEEREKEFNGVQQ